MGKNFKFIIVAFVIGLVFYSFLLSDFNPIFDNKKFKNTILFLRENKTNKKLDSFILMYNKIHKKVKLRRCECETISYYFVHERIQRFQFKSKLYFLKIKKDFSNDDCLKFNLLNADFLYKNIGVENASKYYFKKKIEQLNDDEIITLLIMLENPSLYNPARNPEGIKKKVNVYKQIWNEYQSNTH